MWWRNHNDTFICSDGEFKDKERWNASKKSNNTTKTGEGTPVYNAHCESCGEEYEYKEWNGKYTILGK